MQDFIKQDDNETLDDQIEKLEALKRLLEPEDAEDSMLDELIERIKTVKEAITDLDKNEEVSCSDFYDDDDELPPYYWGGEDGNEIIFQGLE